MRGSLQPRMLEPALWADSRMIFSVLEERSPDTAQYAKCGACDGLLDVRVSHRFGQLEERCPACRSPWRLVPRRVMRAPEPELAGEITGELPGSAPQMKQRASAHKRRERILATLPRSEVHAVTVSDICELVGSSYYRVERDLRCMRDDGLVRRMELTTLVGVGVVP